MLQYENILPVYLKKDQQKKGKSKSWARKGDRVSVGLLRPSDDSPGLVAGRDGIGKGRGATSRASWPVQPGNPWGKPASLSKQFFITGVVLEAS